jgi:hypothetical protein
VDEHEIFFSKNARKFAKEAPTFRIVGVVTVLDLMSGPKNRLFRSATESIWIKQSRLVMVSKDAPFDFHDRVKAFSWIRPISNNVTKAENLLDGLPLDVLHHRIQGCEISVDVADDRPLHERFTPWLRPYAVDTHYSVAETLMEARAGH